jgi:hypothetical protein
MNKTDNTKQVRHGILLLKCLLLPKPAKQRLNYQRHVRHQHQNNLYYTNFVSRLNSQQFMKLHAYFQLKSRKKSCCTFVNYLTKFKTKNCCKTKKYILSK